MVIRPADMNNTNDIKAVLESRVYACVYLYIDFINDGIRNMWLEVDDNNVIWAICLKYHDSFQIFCVNQGHDVHNIVELLKKYNVSMISAERAIIEKISKCLPGYKATYGYVFKMKRKRLIACNRRVEIATESDMKEIAKLICSDSEIGGHYSVDDLEEQFVERLRRGQGRNLIIRENDEIVAHTATYAETDKLAVVSGTIIRENYRNGDYYLALSSKLIDILTEEGKELYTFSTAENVIRHHQIMYEECGQYGKLTKM